MPSVSACLLSYGLRLLVFICIHARKNILGRSSCTLWLDLFSLTYLKADDSFILYYPICRTVRAISSDRGKVVSGSDDQSVFVWDKQTTQLLEELKGHDAQVWLENQCSAALYIILHLCGIW